MNTTDGNPEVVALVSKQRVRIRWRLILPILGLLLFSSGSYESFANGSFGQHRYFWWASIRLDSDTLNKKYPPTQRSCRNNPDGSTDCAVIEPITLCVYPGWLARFLFLTAMPAFLLGIGIVGGLGRIGVSQVWSFMISTPLLILAWFYFVGWLLDRRRLKRQSRLI